MAGGWWSSVLGGVWGFVDRGWSVVGVGGCRMGVGFDSRWASDFGGRVAADFARSCDYLWSFGWLRFTGYGVVSLGSDVVSDTFSDTFGDTFSSYPHMDVSLGNDVNVSLVDDTMRA